MNTETTSPLVDVLTELSRLYPEMRFGQLVEMVAILSCEDLPISVGEVDDERFVEAAARHVTYRRQQLGIEDTSPQDHHLPGPRAELPDLIVRGRDRHPDWRFGVLAGRLAACSGSRLFDAEDEALIEAARRELAG
jgi:hypothetical protein